MKKRFISIVLLIAILFAALGGTGIATNEANKRPFLLSMSSDLSVSDIELYNTHQIFKDVNGTDWFYEYVDYTHFYGLFKGTSEYTFDPSANMTRAMFATVIYRIYELMGLAENIGSPYFTDVYSTEYYYTAVTWCYNSGIINGVGDRKFAPDNPVTRQEVAAILGRLFDLEGTSIPNVYYVDSSSIDSWASFYVDLVTYYELMNGYTDNTFRPKCSITRAECAKVLSKYHYGLNNNTYLR